MDASMLLRRAGYRSQLRDLLHYAYTIAVSNDMATSLQSFGASRDRMVVHYIGVPLENFPFVERESLEPRPPGARIELLQVSNFVEKKGHEYTLAAFRELLGQFPNARLTLGGDGPLRPRIEQRSADLVRSGHVRFVAS